MSRWPTKPLGELLTTLENGSRPKGGVGELPNGIPSLGGEHINREGGFAWDTPKHVARNFYAGMTRGRIQRGDILVVKDGATTGKIAIVRDDFPFREAAINEHVFLLRTDTSKVLPEFVGYFLFGPVGQQQILSNFRGAAIGGIAQDFVCNVHVPLAPLAEQERIVKLLDEADGLRKLRAQADHRTVALVPAIFHEMFGDAAANCKTTTIEDAVKQFIDYRGKTPEKSTSGVPLVTAKIVKGGSILPPNEFIPEESYDAWMRRGLPKTGDVLFTMEAPLGEVAMVENTRIALAQRILLMRPRCDLLDSRYFMTALKMPSVWKQIEERATGSTVRGIRQAELRKVQLPIPPLALQQEFAARVAEIRAVQAVQAASRRRLDDLFQSMLHRAFQAEL
ncbi:MAG: restriction endonuclease subunit S [Candidatus Omnitrophica bacterium]|nr:restriction endonuclease subunit S [Candidatus Omnitrophota bacterium]